MTAEIADDQRDQYGTEAPQQFVADNGQTVFHERLYYVSAFREHVLYPETRSLVNEIHIDEGHEKFAYSRSHCADRRALDPERRRAQLAEDEDVVHRDVHEKGDRVYRHRHVDFFDRAERSHIAIGEAVKQIAYGYYPEIIRAALPDLRVGRKKRHDLHRKRHADHREKKGDNKGQSYGEAHYPSDVLHVALAPVLGDQHSRAASYAEAEHRKQKERLSAEICGRYRDVSQLTQHHRVHQVNAVVYYVLQSDRQYNRHGAQQEPLVQ